ncbi:MAG TPA: protein phosphatase 2C domain-containing protein [Fimbriimonas sp.]|nr:protein phosphatase 2C domain-containing protein [Fimbriimonas sp.]
MSAANAPYQMRLSHFLAPVEACTLPFAVGGATQHKPNATAECRNSQDAVTLRVGRDTIVAVVADGCSGTHPSLESTSDSSNEIGAKLLAYVAAEEAFRLSGAIGTSSDDEIARRLDNSVVHRLDKMLQALVVGKSEDRERFAFDFLMSTILGFIVCERGFILFHCGDGVAAVNGEIQLLEDCAGLYLGNRLLTPRVPRWSPTRRDAIQVIGRGALEGLDSLFLATDGFYKICDRYPTEIADFIRSTPEPDQIVDGVDLLVPEFRKKVAWNPSVSIALDDEATFAVLRRCRAGDTDADGR